ncbi:hypothetical protein [Nocardia salmonicida]|uniref:hypothetical protein n=1 Tax=Nocardia salmonicida TaxID=53431 RepID=UPI003CEBCA41
MSVALDSLVVDVAIAIAAATGGMASGIVVAAASYRALVGCGGVLALTIVLAVVVAAQRFQRGTANEGRSVSITKCSERA